MKKTVIFSGFILIAAVISRLEGAGLANPAAVIPEARFAVGASYCADGYTITNQNIPAIFNQFHGTIEYTPWSFLGIGLHAGATEIDVDKFKIGSDSSPVFHGQFGFSGGGHLKLATPCLFNNLLCGVAIAQATIFSSKNSFGTEYDGKDGMAVAGIQIHIRQFGFITVGPQFDLIEGTDKGYDETGTVKYSNVNNVRGWIAIDYFPKVSMSTNKPYVSLEFTASPKATASTRIPIQEFSVAVSIGSITRRLYGVESNAEWEP